MSVLRDAVLSFSGSYNQAVVEVNRVAKEHRMTEEDRRRLESLVVRELAFHLMAIACGCDRQRCGFDLRVAQVRNEARAHIALCAARDARVRRLN